jgi:hypothetical protein
MNPFFSTKPARRRRRTPVAISLLVGPAALCLASSAAATPSCPIEDQTIENAKPNKLYLFFPAAADPNFPESGCTLNTGPCFSGATPSKVQPAQPFDISLLTDYTGTATDLESAVSDVVTDDYCEFNVQVFSTTTVPPTTFANRVTVAVGSDENSSVDGLYGIAQEVDTSDGIPVDYARTWAGTYQVLDGSGTGGDGLLSGANSTVQRWAFAIGGTAAHEAGHTFGLSHADGAATKPGDTDITTHIMPAGGSVPHSARVGFRRHFGDTEYGVLAASVGLSVESLHNWDYTNTNSVNATSLQIEVLSTSAQLHISWFYGGNLSPWTNPTVSAPTGTRSFKGTTYNVFDLTFSTGQAWANGAAGTVPPATAFHVGAAFSEADFSVPNSIIVSNVTLFDSTTTALTLHPRMVGYNAGALDATDGTFALGLFAVDNAAAPLTITDIVVQQFPRVLSLQNMVQNGAMTSFDGAPVVPWSTITSSLGGPVGSTTQLLQLGAMSQGRHILRNETGQCGEIGVPRDSTTNPEFVNDCPSQGTALDLFPSTTTMVSATVTDPNATHWDPAQQRFVIGPVVSRVFFQVAGQHPDLNRNGIDDTIDIIDGTSVDTTPHDGVPDEVQRCITQLNTLTSCELQLQNLTITQNDIIRQQNNINACVAADGSFSCCPVPVAACAIGTRSLDLRGRVVVAGNAASDNLTIGASANVAGNANVFGNAFLQSQSKLSGQLDISGQLTLQAGAQILGAINRPGAAAQSVLPTNSVTPGTQNITVNNGATLTLPPGSYGDVIIRARSTVKLSAGVYNLRSLMIEGQTNVTLDTSGGFLGINVSGNVTIFGFAGLNAGDPTKVQLYSTGSSVIVDSNNSFPGTIIAPFGGLDISNFVKVAGCVGGQSVIVDTDSAINGHGHVTGGKQACDAALSTLQTQLTHVQTQIQTQTAVCATDLTAFRTCTGIPAQAGASLTALDWKAPSGDRPIGAGPSDENGGCGVASVGRKIEGGALSFWAFSALFVWFRRRKGARAAAR